MKRLVAGVFAVCAAGAALADPVYDVTEYRNFKRDGAEAYRAGDFAAAERAFASAVLYGPQQAGAFYNLAAAAARRGDTAQALSVLDHFAGFGVFVNLDSDSDFASLRGSAAFARIRDKLARNTAPLCRCKVVYEGTDAPFIAEGVAQDLHTDRIFVASVNQRKIVAIHNGAMHDFAVVPDGMSALGIRINAAHDLLWAAAATLPQGAGNSGDLGKSALLAFDITSGALRYRFDVPIRADRRAFGDMIFAQDGTAYVSDAVDGSIFRLKPGADALESVAGSGRFSSPQGMVVSEDGRTLLVADYTAGLQRFDIESGDLANIPVPAGITTLGIDGLVQLRDGSFAATQNGIGPNRVVRFRLSQDWSRLVSFAVIARATADVADISLLTQDGNDVLVSGVSQWGSFDEAASPARPLKPWRIVRVTMP
jgi:sugar lactone lactonase YvrE